MKLDKPIRGETTSRLVEGLQAGSMCAGDNRDRSSTLKVLLYENCYLGTIKNFLHGREGQLLEALHVGQQLNRDARFAKGMKNGN